MGKGSSAPAPVSYAQQMSDSLETQVKLAPDLYKAQAEYQPKYAALDMQTLRDAVPEYGKIDAAARDASTATDIALIDKYGQRVSDSLRHTSGNEELLKTLNAQALDEVNAGATLDPSLRREVQQSVRAGQAARGFGYGRNDLASEAYLTAMQAEQLRRTRQQFGIQMVGVNQATGGDPFMALLGRQSTPNIQQPQGATLFSPESQMNADLNNQAYQAKLSTNAANSANKSALIGAGIGGVALIGAAVF